MKKNKTAEASSGKYFNSGSGISLAPIDIGHKNYIGVVDPETAFWSLVKKNKLGEFMSDSKAIKDYRKKAADFKKEIDDLRFNLKPSAVYFNPTERCNLNCTYCYIPEKMRKSGKNMSEKKLIEALSIMKKYFKKTAPKGVIPQVVFHGAEPMVNSKAVFAGIEKFSNDFRFGVQTNATLLDDESIDFLKSHGVGIGLSLDGPVKSVADKTRKTWEGDSVYKKVIETMDKLKGYSGFNVITTVTTENMKHIDKMVDFYHKMEVPVCMLNIVRCTLKGSRTVKPNDKDAAKYFMKALDRTYELYKKTGRKLVVANFANVLVSIIAPMARRLMCDISPCGGGRCFFSLTPDGGMFPCSEFVGLKEFNGGNLFKDNIDKVFKSEAFNKVTGRKVEDIAPCNRCSIRHFCGSPCPAEAHEMNGAMTERGAFCEFYEEQVRYCLRLLADNKHDAFLWDGWDKGTQVTFNIA
ncbi:MAG: peptide-modifying radical SAM enzyme CbpB [Planctomycetota bacterium]|jgi:uncharacterized protein